MEVAFEKMEEKELKVDMIRDLQDKYRTRLSSSAKVTFDFSQDCLSYPQSSVALSSNVLKH